VSLLKTILDIFVFGNVLIALAAVALVMATYLQLTGQLLFRPYLVVVFFATFLVYNFHRWIGIKDDHEAGAGRSRWAIRNRFLVKSFIVSGAAGLCISALFLKGNIKLLLLPLFIITFAYSLPLLKGHTSGKRLRDIPWMKTFVIAFVWTVVTVLLPAVREGVGFGRDIAFMLAERFLFILAITIPFDIRDIEDDRRKQVISLAVSLGEKRARLLSYSLVAAFALTVGFHYKDGFTGIAFGLLLSMAPVIYLVSRARAGASEFLYLLWLDGTMILQFLIILLLC
jgi:4-hydroxybenzoate polyprenyltransferase